MNLTPKNNPRYPIFIPSKGRAESRITMRILDSMGVPYRVIVEQSEFSAYASHIAPAKLLVLDPAYQRDYDRCDDWGDALGPGSGPARNFAWDTAKSEGAFRHWVVDDNIFRFYRLHDNAKIQVDSGVFFQIMEDFVDRYTNVAMAGPNYEFFAPRRKVLPPFVANTRIYSCNLIQTDLPFRWRGRFNEDTDLSIRMLKAGLCTVLFNALLQKKARTLQTKGGNTDTIYINGTLAKSEMIARLHPDVAKVAWRFNRAHHHVDYSPFATNKLILKAGLKIPSAPVEYGMTLAPENGFARASRK